jgi:hypothetical protein
MESSNGNKVPNQFEIETPEGRYFQSYQTIIAFWPKQGKIQLDTKSWDCSVTTGKYRNAFLMDDGIADTRKKIKSGEYELADLN